jgi:hypothetical protein
MPEVDTPKRPLRVVYPPARRCASYGSPPPATAFPLPRKRNAETHASPRRTCRYVRVAPMAMYSARRPAASSARNSGRATSSGYSSMTASASMTQRAACPSPRLPCPAPRRLRSRSRRCLECSRPVRADGPCSWTVERKRESMFEQISCGERPYLAVARVPQRLRVMAITPGS